MSNKSKQNKEYSDPLSRPEIAPSGSKNLRSSRIPEFSLQPYYDKLKGATEFPMVMRGRVRRIIGNVIKASLPNARIGEICTIEPPGRPPVKAQVVGFDDEDVFLTPFDPLHEVGPKTPIVNRGASLKVAVGPELLGRVIDSLGEPIDGLGNIETQKYYPIQKKSPESMKRVRINSILRTGVRSIDSMLTIGEGQRVGVFSTAGVGKSSLLGMLARNSQADVNVVALVGERGREVLDFLEDNLGEGGLKKSVVVVSTSDEPPLRRIMAGYAATAIAEYFRDQGKQVLLLMDSVTRFARALREISLSIGELPARQGYPPSVFTTLPGLLERAGKTEHGSITAFYTILLASEQIEDPLGEEVRAILDGHLYLSSRLAQVAHYPAIDLLSSNSRLMEAIASREHKYLAEELKRIWVKYEENADLIAIGAYKKGADPEIDEAVAKRPDIRKFLCQRKDEVADLDTALERAKSILEG